MSTLKTESGKAKMAMPVRNVASAVRFSASSNCISFSTSASIGGSGWSFMAEANLPQVA